MPPERLARIVAQINALHPDLVLIAGDFVGGQTAATASAMRMPSGRAAGALARAARRRRGARQSRSLDGRSRGRRALRARRMSPCSTMSAAARGPLAIGGLATIFTDHDDLARRCTRCGRLPGARSCADRTRPTSAPSCRRTACCSRGTRIAGRSCCRSTARLPTSSRMATAIAAA